MNFDTTLAIPPRPKGRGILAVFVMSEEKLKTLKDYEFGGFDGVMLREEAKKWIIQIQAKIKEKEGQIDDFGTDMGMRYAEAGEAIIGFIKHFFDLEGEK